MASRRAASRSAVPVLGALFLVLSAAIAAGLTSARTARIAGTSAAGVGLVWSDEFAGRAGVRPDRRHWRMAIGGGGWGNAQLEYDTARAANVALDGRGHLLITARRQHYGSGGQARSYTSARLETKGLFATAYGTIEARIEVPAGRGLWPAFWALGNDIEAVGWPASGEIDVMESLGQDPFTVHGTIHGPIAGSGASYQVQGSKVSATSLAGAFHTYGVIWRPGSITWTLDGAPYATASPGALRAGERWVFDQPFYLLLNLAVGGNWPGSPSAATRFPARMLIDWVRVYSGARSQ